MLWNVEYARTYYVGTYNYTHLYIHSNYVLYRPVHGTYRSFSLCTIPNHLLLMHHTYLSTSALPSHTKLVEAYAFRHLTSRHSASAACTDGAPIEAPTLPPLSRFVTVQAYLSLDSIATVLPEVLLIVF